MLWSARKNGGGHKFESGACCKNTIDFSKEKKLYLRFLKDLRRSNCQVNDKTYRWKIIAKRIMNWLPLSSMWEHQMCC